MTKPLPNKLQDSLYTGFIDRSFRSDEFYQPRLLVNQKKPRRKVLTSILQQLESCKSFYISVAFVTRSGVATLINSLKNLEREGVQGKVLVSQYLNFTEPEALRALLQFSNVELRIAVSENAHSKGYIFESRDNFNVIIGSSNLTASALATNREWNLKVSALRDSAIMAQVLGEFDRDFSYGILVTEQYIQEYQSIYQAQRLKVEAAGKLAEQTVRRLVANSMQVEALVNLKNLRGAGKTKALIISATGTGKTYLSAFDAQAFGAKKLLFVVHRLTIAEKAMRSFMDVFGTSRSMGLYSGNRKELDKEFVFSTVQTISKARHLEAFPKDHYEYIIIDESHRSGAESYKRLIAHFEPKFLLGMTATPERTDGNDIFSLFDHNIAYEIRLSQAMEEDMLCQFHYYGVTDLSVNNEVLENASDFNLLTADERVDQMLRYARFYGTDNGIVRGLVFCSRVEVAEQLSRKFNERGLKSVALSGQNSELERTAAIARLESESLSEKLDYIFSVDVFNEGVDIPRVNQILLVRPTESAIIFIQQIGRGLRKADGKGYLTIIDFIGNYKNNYLIPIALYGDTSYSKDSLRKLLSEGSNMIPGASTINFDKITKERIFNSIDSANLSLLADLRKDYLLLKYKLGRTPLMTDFVKHGHRDPFLFVQHSKSFYSFAARVDKENIVDISDRQKKLLELYAKEINNCKRVEECVLLKQLITKREVNMHEFRRRISTKYGHVVTEDTLRSILRNLNFQFVREKENGKLKPVSTVYDLELISFSEGIFARTQQLDDFLQNTTFKKYLLDSVNYSIERYDVLYQSALWRDGFVLYRKYSRKDVFRILNVEQNPVAQNVGGYLVSPDNKHCPIFVNYDKEEHISASTKYEDEFISSSEFSWMSKSNRKITSKDVQAILGKYGPIRLPLFIKKSNDEGKDFYYMGDVYPDTHQVEQTEMSSDSGRSVSVVKILFKLQDPVVDSLYAYLTAAIVGKAKEQPTSQVELPVIRPIVEEKKTTIPLYSFYAAAGSFSELQVEKDYEQINISGELSLSENYFACRVLGESMNRIIPNGSLCLFKMYQGGSRNGKVVLVEYQDYQDPDFNSAFTVKTYTSEKSIEEDNWRHTSIVLKPNSYDDRYGDIVVDQESARSMRVLAEFVRVIE